MPETTVHIHAPRPVDERCIVIDCPTCGRPRRAFSAYYEWYGASTTCAGCGEHWEDGYRTERPFYQHWRRDMRRYAIQQLARIGAKA